jgi:hypothetical protein
MSISSGPVCILSYMTLFWYSRLQAKDGSGCKVIFRPLKTNNLNYRIWFMASDY